MHYDLILIDSVIEGVTATPKTCEIEIDKSCYAPIMAFKASAMAKDRQRFLASEMDETHPSQCK